MDFTREPVVESVVTPKEGCKLVIRSSKTSGQEEYFVDAVEVVRFGEAVFFRSLERPKSFLVPVTDYEVVEVRETRMVLKTSGGDKGAIKIGGGRAAEKGESEKESKKSEGRVEKKRRRGSRRRKAREEREETVKEETSPEAEVTAELEGELTAEGGKAIISPSLTSLLPPPKTLIRETISRYKEDDLFKEAFYTPGEDEDEPSEEPPVVEGESSDEPLPLEEGTTEEEVSFSEEEQSWPEEPLPIEEETPSQEAEENSEVEATEDIPQ